MQRQTEFTFSSLEQTYYEGHMDMFKEQKAGSLFQVQY